MTGTELEIQNPSHVKLSEREEKFLSVLMTEAKGDFKVARDLAGYPKNTNVLSIVKKLKTEIVDVVQLYMAQQSPFAISVLLDILASPEPVPDARSKIAAAKELLDRAGIVKTVKSEVEHKHGGGVALLPPKNS